MIPVTTAVLAASPICLAVALAGFVIGREDRRRLSRLRAVWRAEVATELHAAHQAALLIAEQRGAARARETYDAEAATDHMVCEARAEITDLREQLDLLSRRLREDDRTDATEAIA